MFHSSCVRALAGAGVLFALAEPAAADAFDSYGRSYRSIAMPPIGAGSFFLKGDALPDGRIVAVTGNSIFLESGVGSGVFAPVATFDPMQSGGATDPSFLRVSPSGSTLAVGIGFGRPVCIVPLAALGSPGAPTLLTPGIARYYPVPHYDGAWLDGTRLAITAGAFGSPASVTLLDTVSDPAHPVDPPIITDIGGASAGIVFDSAGRLYTGNGFDMGPGGSDTGTIRAFSPADWAGGPADFETAGTLIGRILSAEGLNFDPEGNLFVGGGDFAGGQTGYLAVVNGAAVARALAGLGPLDPADPAALHRLDPRADGLGFFGSAFNPLTHELYITDGSTWYATIPAPAPLAILIGLSLLSARRRDHA